MEKATFKFDILQKEIETMASKTSKWSRENKKKSFAIYLLIAILTASVTLLVAVGDSIPVQPDCQDELKFWIKLLILILSGLSTVLAAWDGFYNHKQLWINYGETRNKLRALLLQMKLFTEEEKLDMKKVDIIYNEYQSIINSGNDKWIKLRELEIENEAKNIKGNG
jgi:hypothetical protein